MKNQEPSLVKTKAQGDGTKEGEERRVRGHSREETDPSYLGKTSSGIYTLSCEGKKNKSKDLLGSWLLLSTR